MIPGPTTATTIAPGTIHPGTMALHSWDTRFCTIRIIRLRITIHIITAIMADTHPTEATGVMPMPEDTVVRGIPDTRGEVLFLDCLITQDAGLQEQAVGTWLRRGADTHSQLDLDLNHRGLLLAVQTDREDRVQ